MWVVVIYQPEILVALVEMDYAQESQEAAKIPVERMGSILVEGAFLQQH
jgi:hypothetical protein